MLAHIPTLSHTRTIVWTHSSMRMISHELCDAETQLSTRDSPKSPLTLPSRSCISEHGRLIFVHSCIHVELLSMADTEMRMHHHIISICWAATLSLCATCHRILSVRLAFRAHIIQLNFFPCSAAQLLTAKGNCYHFLSIARLPTLLRRRTSVRSERNSLPISN